MQSITDNLIKIFEYALNQEKTGMSFFSTSLERLGTGAAVTAFKVLIEEEKKHIKFISDILNDLKAKGEIDQQHVQNVVLDESDYFKQRAQSELLEQSIEGSMIPDVTVFNTAYLIEKDLSEFYDRMANTVTDQKAKDALKMLSDWEKTHELYFKQFRDKLTDEYSRMPWGG
ncbi:MAG: ferritin family protein [candidate division KSB1 bacterium]|nr:ferritin family protein [candidate division KSB1 bacterium]MDZ7335550.1 ferritin family protein [candidate division KSB1 bacterium]MDZ7356916.1 ferritin family protein [candidate division KSB1 bacterium]MDZ7399253.1 ferritin family protein [candidate division KSB1 bacterium]